VPIRDDQHQKVLEWMESRKVQPRCTMCGEDQWDVFDIINAPVIAKEGEQAPTRGVPMIVTFCQNCAHVVLFSAARVLPGNYR